jgi:MFS transporter, PPP family, 3-phenylpropionic acid transporter
LSLFRLRAFYFVTGFTGGVLIPYLSILFEHDGFSSTEIGIIMAMGTVFSVLVQPGWGYIVDRFHVTRIALALSSLVPGIAAIVFQIHWLWVVVLANLLFNVFSTPQAPIADSYAINLVRKTNQSYGSIRLFASLGWAIAAYFAGYYIAWLPVTSLWIPYLLLSLLGALVAMTFGVGSLDIEPDSPNQTNSTNLANSANLSDISEQANLANPANLSRPAIQARTGSPESTTGAVHPEQGIGALLRSPTFLLFLAGGFLASQTLTAFNTYFALTFQSMGGSVKLTGVAFFLASATNVPAMLLSTRVIRFVGRENVLVLASVAYVLRWGVQAWIHIPLVAILIQILHGVSFGFYYIAAVDFVSTSASREMQATAQTIFGVVCSGLAGIVGNLLNGYLLGIGGPDLMYTACALSALLSAVCFFAVSRKMAKRMVHRTGESSAFTLNN